MENRKIIKKSYYHQMKIISLIRDIMKNYNFWGLQIIIFSI
jgi:hypothetical protein